MVVSQTALHVLKVIVEMSFPKKVALMFTFSQTRVYQYSCTRVITK